LFTDFTGNFANKSSSSSTECNNNYLAGDFAQLSPFSGKNLDAKSSSEQTGQLKPPIPAPRKNRPNKINTDLPNAAGNSHLPHTTVASPTTDGRPHNYALVCKLPSSPEGKAYSSPEYEFITHMNMPQQ